MKKGERFQLSAAWWDKNKATTLKSDLNLGQTLKKYEAAVKELKAKPSEDQYKATIKLLGEVGSVAKTLAGKCTLPLHAETKSALLTAPAVVAAASTPLAKEAAEWQQRLARARKRLSGVAAKATRFRDVAQLAKDSGKSFVGKLETGNRKLAILAYKEFVEAYKEAAGLSIAYQEMDAETREWVLALQPSEGREIQTVLEHMHLGELVWQSFQREYFQVYMGGKQLIQEKCPA